MNCLTVEAITLALERKGGERLIKEPERNL